MEKAFSDAPDSVARIVAYKHMNRIILFQHSYIELL